MLGRTLLLSAWLAVMTGAKSGPCQPISLPQCQGLPYKTTRLPGLLGDSSEVGRDIDARLSAILASNCSRILTLVACAVYVPPCHRVAVSADICQLAQRDCQSALRQVGLAWPKLLECKTPLPQTSPSDHESKAGKSSHTSVLLLNMLCLSTNNYPSQVNTHEHLTGRTSSACTNNSQQLIHVHDDDDATRPCYARATLFSKSYIMYVQIALLYTRMKGVRLAL